MGGAKSLTFTIESLGTDKGVLKSIAGKQTDACLFSKCSGTSISCVTCGAGCCCRRGPTIGPVSQSSHSADLPHSPFDTKSCCFLGKTCPRRKTCWHTKTKGEKKKNIVKNKTKKKMINAGITTKWWVFVDWLTVLWR